MPEPPVPAVLSVPPVLPLSRRMALASLAAFCCGTARASARIQQWNPPRPTPALDLQAIDGKRWDLASLRGKAIILNFWASWCDACLAEMPQLDRLARQHSTERGLVVLGINYQEGDAAIRRFAEKTPVSFPLLRDADGRAFRSWGGTVLPTSVLLSRNTRALTTIAGEMDWASARADRLLRPLLAGNPMS
jgi:thiol-disulfide isomerase/thioredoxin